MDSKYFLAILLVSFVAISGCTQQEANTTVDTMEIDDSMTENDDSTQGDAMMEIGNFTISRTDDGYEPSQITIKKGSTVTFVNNSSEDDWPASAMHPTHTVYPGSGIEKCGTLEESQIFDACRALGNGESYSFTFNEAGEWGFHNHVAVMPFGKIIVVE